jgi:hypothetical protein
LLEQAGDYATREFQPLPRRHHVLIARTSWLRARQAITESGWRVTGKIFSGEGIPYLA